MQVVLQLWFWWSFARHRHPCNSHLALVQPVFAYFETCCRRCFLQSTARQFLCKSVGHLTDSPAPPLPVLIGISAANSLSLLSAASFAANASSFKISARPCVDGDRVFPNPPRPACVTRSADESRGAIVRPRSPPGMMGSPPLRTAGLLGLRTALPAPPLSRDGD